MVSGSLAGRLRSSSRISRTDVRTSRPTEIAAGSINAAAIIAIKAVLASAPEISRVEKGKVAKMLDALVADQPALELLRRRAGDVANDLIDNAGEAVRGSTSS